VLLVDTGVIVAAADRSDPHHDACAQLLEQTDGSLITSPLVIAEAAYLINQKLGATAELALYTAIIDDALLSSSRRSPISTGHASENSPADTTISHSAAQTRASSPSPNGLTQAE
jgi:predicted nucleic acid-binding protein